MNTLVLDVGKTHIKAHLFDARGYHLAMQEAANRPLQNGDYPSADVDGIWHWFLDRLASFQAEYGVDRISVTTHGATAALINPEEGNNGLVLPVLDYEFTGVESRNLEYNALRPGFDETGSPGLPAGLNLGRQLFWLSRQYPEAFDRSAHILLYPQYWVWRLTGRCYSEVTSLGCHTDLWLPWKNAFSSLVETQGWQDKFPHMVRGWDIAGTVTQETCAATSVPDSCVVHVGVHDSNADYLCYKRHFGDKPFTMLSTGTWSIAMNGNAERSVLDEHRDMLVNVDINGTPVICSRFMGGREYALICEQFNGEMDAEINQTQISSLINANVYCLPTWQSGTGPFSSNRPEIAGILPTGIPAAALAALYCALVLDYQLDLVDAKETIILAGAFLKNELLCGLLTQLRSGQTIIASDDNGGAASGAAQLARWHQQPFEFSLTRLSPTRIEKLERYRSRWRQNVGV